MRATAWATVAVGAAAPLLRKRVNAPPVLVQTVAYAAPLGLAVAARRSHRRDVAICALQMWAYVAAYKFPHDDPQAQERRVRIRYPIAFDRVLGLGELPSLRLQRSLSRSGPEGPRWRALDDVLVWAHWSWFMVPHGSILYVLVRRRALFPRAAVMMYATFNLGASVYWLLPTAPPWWPAVAESRGREGGEAVRRMMVEYGEDFWKDGWGSLYSVFGGNPLAAMPSLHFATSLMAALLLAEVGPIAGAFGFAYTATLGFALVYLGEHYVVDLLAGAALTVAVRRLEPAAAPAIGRVGRAVAALEARAHQDS
ncbi:MAG TPA: phosphatase PAP2 family protein [Solirubrobacteraceae bacterium]|jgi:membrane-associated phospholipid phosphatase|nr:phosphatase PAP2 family protein [Solirubrobacteraceae bacterium]